MGRARASEFQGWAILRWASGLWENPEPYLLLPRLRALPLVPLRGDWARERARGRAKALTLCADTHTQCSAHEHAQAEGVHRGAGPLGAASRHQLPRSGPPGLHAARPRTELRHQTDGLCTTSSTRRPHRLRQKTVRYCLTISRSTPYVKSSEDGRKSLRVKSTEAPLPLRSYSIERTNTAGRQPTSGRLSDHRDSIVRTIRSGKRKRSQGRITVDKGSRCR
ncbi:hypothetical protein HPB51_028873 [Rhipicephalus microplus]|uniref:Uncharacterized protein n=1 Tax=Rhipicephalus microplus TaxID=6941 RepID=A0A9J6CWF0_RHIMP|nr:hypothetical protein HPB51_028873 [Rhipicephalus microplus]